MRDEEAFYAVLFWGFATHLSVKKNPLGVDTSLFEELDAIFAASHRGHPISIVQAALLQRFPFAAASIRSPLSARRPTRIHPNAKTQQRGAGLPAGQDDRAFGFHHPAFALETDCKGHG